MRSIFGASACRYSRLCDVVSLVFLFASGTSFAVNSHIIRYAPPRLLPHTHFAHKVRILLHLSVNSCARAVLRTVPNTRRPSADTRTHCGRDEIIVCKWRLVKHIASLDCCNCQSSLCSQVAKTNHSFARMDDVLFSHHRQRTAHSARLPLPRATRQSTRAPPRSWPWPSETAQAMPSCHLADQNP